MSAADPAGQAGRWLRYAREDLRLAEATLRSPSAAPRHTCFLAQQSAEKAIKALLIFAGVDFPRTHDLDLLRDLIPADWPVRSEIPDLGALTEWAIDSRYPSDWPDPTPEDAAGAVAQAHAVVESVVRDLLRHGLAEEER